MISDTAIAALATTTVTVGIAAPTVAGRTIVSITRPYVHKPAPTAAQTASRSTCSETSVRGRRSVDARSSVSGAGVSNRG